MLFKEWFLVSVYHIGLWCIATDYRSQRSHQREFGITPPRGKKVTNIWDYSFNKYPNYCVHIVDTSYNVIFHLIHIYNYVSFWNKIFSNIIKVSDNNHSKKGKRRDVLSTFLVTWMILWVNKKDSRVKKFIWRVAYHMKASQRVFANNFYE